MNKNITEIPDNNQKSPKSINIKYYIKKSVFCIIIGIIITLLSACIPIMIENAQELDAMKFGWPITFITQSTPFVPPIDWFPNYAAPNYFLYTTTIQPSNFVLSLIINIVIISIISFLIIILKKRNRMIKEKRPVIVNKKL